MISSSAIGDAMIHEQPRFGPNVGAVASLQAAASIGRLYGIGPLHREGNITLPQAMRGLAPDMMGKSR